MRILRQPALAIGLLAAAAAVAGTLVLALPGQHSTAEPVAKVDATPAVPVTAPEQPTAENPENVSPPAPEPEQPVTNEDVAALMRGTLDAIERGDRAWLARTMQSTAGRELTEDDLLAAYRQFLWRSAQPMWARIRYGWQSGDWQLEDKGGSAEVVLHVGGALGEMRLEFKRIDNAWYYAGV